MFRNFTGFSFIGKVGKLSLEFTAGMVEEITFNLTDVGVVNAAEIPESINVKIISKEQLLTTTSAAMSSRVVQNHLIDVIASATPNLFI